MISILTPNLIDDLSKTGIYKITCIPNSKIYVGSAFSIKAPSITKKGFYGRWRSHIRRLKLNKHSNIILQNSWNKYGENAFEFEILEICEDRCIEREEYWMNTLSTLTPNGFNICRNALSNPYAKTEEQRQHLANLFKGKKRDKSIFKTILKPVLQLDRYSGEVIAEFYGVSEAYRQTGIQRQDIGKCCAGKLRSAGGYIWKFKNDEIV